MDWGLGNPNKTAVLIGCLMALSWALAHLRRGGFAMALAAFTALGACLIHTYSRGGVIAAVAGQLVLLAKAARPWPHARMIGILLAVAALVTYASLDATDAARRFGQSPTTDRSIGNRLDIWRSAPRMMADAPSGWGFGRSGWAYTQWYQSTATRYEYRTLVNSHLTWMAELGWPGRIAYLAVVFAILAVCWPQRSGSAVPLAVWVVFLCGAAFSSTMESPVLWALPAAALIHRIRNRHVARVWPTGVAWASILVLTLAIAASVALLGTLAASSPSIHGSPSKVRVGHNGPLFILADPDPRVLGTHYGIEVRQSTQQRQWIVSKGLKERNLHASPEAIILSGRPSDSVSSALKTFPAARLVWFNPPNGEILERNIAGHSDGITLIYGQRRSDLGFRGSVKTARALGIEPVVVRGAAMYLREWSSFLNAQKENR